MIGWLFCLCFFLFSTIVPPSPHFPLLNSLAVAFAIADSSILLGKSALDVPVLILGQIISELVIRVEMTSLQTFLHLLHLFGRNSYGFRLRVEVLPMLRAVVAWGLCSFYVYIYVIL